MEKYARQAVSEGIKQTEDLRVLADSEIFRVLNLHYNRNNHIEVSSEVKVESVGWQAGSVKRPCAPGSRLVLGGAAGMPIVALAGASSRLPRPHCPPKRLA